MNRSIPFTVFVSSTSEDLREYRAVARNVILDQNWKPEMMEHFGSLAEATMQAIYRKLDGCDLMLLIVAFRRGWVPTAPQGGDGASSVTALELAYARAKNIPVLAMLASESWPLANVEDDPDALRWIRQFRAGLNMPATFFDWEDSAKEAEKSLPAFRAKVGQVLVAHRERLAQESESKAQTPVREIMLDPVAYEAATEAVRSGEYIPFIGGAIHGDGGLSTAALIATLGGPMQNDPALAAVAEYRQHVLGTREKFLKVVLQALAGTNLGCEPAAYQLILRYKPPVIVNAMSDLSLERCIEATGRKVFIVCHVIRSRNGAHDGKIARFAGTADTNPSITLADGVDLPQDAGAYIVYKPLGCPLLDGNASVEKGIDTLVMTEEDHLVLLGYLENAATGVPTALSRYFQRYPLVFLGYPLDVWHCRLVTHVFNTVRAGSAGARDFAVRTPASNMELMAWKALHVDLLAMDANEFAAKSSPATATP